MRAQIKAAKVTKTMADWHSLCSEINFSKKYFFYHHFYTHHINEFQVEFSCFTKFLKEYSVYTDVGYIDLKHNLRNTLLAKYDFTEKNTIKHMESLPLNILAGCFYELPESSIDLVCFFEFLLKSRHVNSTNFNYLTRNENTDDSYKVFYLIRDEPTIEALCVFDECLVEASYFS